MEFEVRDNASFLALVVDATTKTMPSTLTSTDIRCFKKGCHGTVRIEILRSSNEIHWMCSIE